MANLNAEAKGPFVKRAEDGGQNTSRIMLDVIIALAVLFAFAFWKNGIKPYLQYDAYVEWYEKIYKTSPDIPGKVYVLVQPLLVMVVACIVAIATEGIFFKVTKRVNKFTEGCAYAVTKSYALIPPMILVLIIPVNAPIFAVVITTILMTVFGKLVFGGFGKNIFNPAAVGVALFVALYGGIMGEYNGWFNYTSDSLAIVGGATGLENAQNFGWIGNYFQLVGRFGSLMDFFIGTIPGSLGETSALVILLGGIFLLVRKAITWEIPVVYVGTIFVSTWIYGMFQGVPGSFGAVWYPTFHILSGGVMFAAVFMFTEPVTSPISTRGRVIYAFIGGILTVLFRLTAGTPGGVATAIITVNLFTTIIDNRASIVQAANSFKKKAISAAMVAVLGIAVLGFTVWKNPNKADLNSQVLETIKANKNAQGVLLLEEAVNSGTTSAKNRKTSYKVRTFGWSEIEMTIVVSREAGNEIISAKVTKADGETKGTNKNFGGVFVKNQAYLDYLIECINDENYLALDYNGTLNFEKELTAGATKTGTGLINALLDTQLWTKTPSKRPAVHTDVTEENGVYTSSATGFYGKITGAIEFEGTGTDAKIKSISFTLANANEGSFDGNNPVNWSNIEAALVNMTLADIQAANAGGLTAGSTYTQTANAIQKLIVAAFNAYNGGAR